MSFLQSTEEADQRWRGVHIASGVDHLDAGLDAIVVDAAIARSLTQCRSHPRAIVLYGSVVDETAKVTLGIAVVAAYMHFVAVLPQALDLCQHLLADAAGRVKAVIGQE